MTDSEKVAIVNKMIKNGLFECGFDERGELSALLSCCEIVLDFESVGETVESLFELIKRKYNV